MEYNEHKPIYLQNVDLMQEKIVRGEWAEEERIPSVREYAALVEVNANTVVRTYDYLQSQEIIYTRRGLGYFVCPGAGEKISSLRRTTFMEVELPEFFKQLRALDIPIEEIVRMYGEYKG